MGENSTGRLATYYVAECMEFNHCGEYREDIQSAEEVIFKTWRHDRLYRYLKVRTKILTIGRSVHGGRGVE